jgi:8-oxo-dGTP pyrophosphatase MutT (NUDIX family)
LTVPQLTVDRRSLLIESIAGYQMMYAQERGFKEKFLELLTHPHAFFRDHLPGHITASAWIIDESRKFTLLTHHAKLNRWLQPGGHADGDEDVLNVAMKEACEETGLTSLQALTPHIFDLDIHLIPARNEFPSHDHYDIRFLFLADRSERFTITAESHDLAWVGRDEIAVKTGGNVSIMRMAEKSVDRSH